MSTEIPSVCPQCQAPARFRNLALGYVFECESAMNPKEGVVVQSRLCLARQKLNQLKEAVRALRPEEWMEFEGEIDAHGYFPVDAARRVRELLNE